MKQTPFVVGAGNVFADLGLADADELLVKADFAHAINTQIKASGWTQAQVVERTGLTQPEVSKIGRMKTSGFSQERLQKVLRTITT
jgi:predicted XRE-type DNA-binding protein